MTTIDYMTKLGIPGLHVVGGAVRDYLLGKTPTDYDFIAIGQDNHDLHSSLSYHGRVDDLIVADRCVGVRFWPRDKRILSLNPKGIEICPPRREISTGPKHTDFDIVADSSVSFEQDAMRRDFTINSMAMSLDTGDILDPLDGQRDLRSKIISVTSKDSFRDDPLRIIRGLRFISQFDFNLSPATWHLMEQFSEGIEHLSGERVKEQMDKLLMGQSPLKALRVMRDTGVLAILFPELATTIGFEQQSKYHHLTVDEHIFHVVQYAADNDSSLEVRWAALLHDSGKPESAWMGEDNRLHYYENPAVGKRNHEDIGADNARAVMDRMCDSVTERNDVAYIVKHHMFQEHNTGARRSVRKFLSRHGEVLAFMLIAHKRADITGKGKDNENARLDSFEAMMQTEIAIGNAFTVKQLRINGNDLAEIGVPKGPKMGWILRQLLDEVIDDPENNDPSWLLGRAQELNA